MPTEPDAAGDALFFKETGVAYFTGFAIEVIDIDPAWFQVSGSCGAEMGDAPGIVKSRTINLT